MTGTYRIFFDAGPTGYRPHDYEQKRAQGWHALVFTCQSLAGQGVKYTTRLEQVEDGRFCVTVRASGDPQIRRATKPTSYVATTPGPPTIEQCQRRAQEAAKEQNTIYDLFRYHVKIPADYRRSKWNYWGDAGRERRLRYKAFGHLVARILARRKIGGDPKFYDPTREDYRDLDTLLGRKVRRWSKLREHEQEAGYLPTIVKDYAHGVMGRERGWDRAEESADYDYLTGRKSDAAPPVDPLCELPPQPEIPLYRRYVVAKADVQFWRDCERLLLEKKQRRGKEELARAA